MRATRRCAVLRVPQLRNAERFPTRVPHAVQRPLREGESGAPQMRDPGCFRLLGLGESCGAVGGDAGGEIDLPGEVIAHRLRRVVRLAQVTRSLTCPECAAASLPRSLLDRLQAAGQVVLLSYWAIS